MIDPALMTKVMAFLEPRMEHRAGRPGESTDALLRALRERFVGVHFSVCSDDDLPARLPPAAESGICRLYYVASGGHCLRLTNAAESATGLVVAMLDEDE